MSENALLAWLRKNSPRGVPYFEVPITKPLTAEEAAKALEEGIVRGEGLKYMPWLNPERGRR